MKIIIGDKEFVKDGDNLIEKDKLKAYDERMKTYFKVGGKLCNTKMPNSKDAIEGQKD
jgi:hypothetical protein|tara:strand:+ start:2989 stop:3162 length:174 start_codon:yes stop_codon:yes gene_type:complete